MNNNTWHPYPAEEPELEQYVLITIRFIGTDRVASPTCVYCYGEIWGGGMAFLAAHDADERIMPQDVIAWMPLPEPYQPAGTETYPKRR